MTENKFNYGYDADDVWATLDTIGDPTEFYPENEKELTALRLFKKIWTPRVFYCEEFNKKLNDEMFELGYHINCINTDNIDENIVEDMLAQIMDSPKFMEEHSKMLDNAFEDYINNNPEIFEDEE